MNHDKGISNYRDLPIELIKDMEDAVVKKLSALTGENIEAWRFIPDKPRPHWSPETKPLIEQFKKLATEISVSGQRRRVAYVNKIAFGKKGKLPN